MVENSQGGSGGPGPSDGFLESIAAFRTQSIELIGTLEVISQQADLFEQSNETGSAKRQLVTKMIVELTSKVSKLDTLASKTMNIVFIGDPNATENNLPHEDSESSTNNQ